MTTIHRVWVTRARPGASRTADRLAGLGFQPIIAPLLAIQIIPQAVPDLTGIAALAFTSANGVTAFAALTGDRTRPVFTVGDATAQAARAAGFASVQSAAGAIADLAELLIAKVPGQGAVLVPGAQQPAGDLTAMLSDQVEVRRLPVYASVQTGAGAPSAFDAVMVHSARAGLALATLGPFTGQTAVAISEAAAAPLAGVSGLDIRVASSPDESALFAALGKPAPRV